MKVFLMAEIKTAVDGQDKFRNTLSFVSHTVY